MSSMLRIKLYMVCTLVVVLISINIYTRSKLDTRHGIREAKFKKEKMNEIIYLLFNARYIGIYRLIGTEL